MATVAPRRTITRLGRLQVAICALVAATALVHLALGVITSVMVATQPARVASMGGATALSIMAALFYGCGIGYVALGTALYHPALQAVQRRTRQVLLGFTALTFVAYFAMAQGHIDAFGLADKACEGLLLALLVVDGRRAR